MRNEISKVFHPGYYLKEYIEEMQMTQDEFAKRLGISGKQISLILAENASVTADIAYKLSKLIGTSVDLWLNLQSQYDSYKVQVEQQQLFEEEKIIYKMIDKNFLIQLGIVDKEDKIDEAISKLRYASTVSSLTLHKQKDIYCFYRTTILKDESIENIVCRNVWVSIASSIAKKENIESFNENKLLDNIKTFRDMTLEKPEIFYPNMKKILNECGVALVILPSLKNSNTNGVVKWINNEKVMIALNTKGAYNDKFWFSFFHELKHALQKRKRKIIIGEEKFIETLDSVCEYDAEIFSKETLVPSNKLDDLQFYDENSIISFAKSINIHPGIVVGRLQKEKKIKYSQLNHLKEKYDIDVLKY